MSILGKFGKEVPADAIVLCTGAYTSTVLYSTLGVFAPITPIKSYTFDVPTTSEFNNTHLFLQDEAMTAAFMKPGLWRMSLFGDLAGLNLDLDNRRARMAKNTFCINIDTAEGLLAQNIKAVLRACSPDDLPIVGALKLNPNVYVNSGHGGRNAALSIASSKILAQLLAG